MDQESSTQLLANAKMREKFSADDERLRNNASTLATTTQAVVVGGGPGLTATTSLAPSFSRGAAFSHNQLKSIVTSEILTSSNKHFALKAVLRLHLEALLPLVSKEIFLASLNKYNPATDNVLLRRNPLSNFLIIRDQQKSLAHQQRNNFTHQRNFYSSVKIVGEQITLLLLVNLLLLLLCIVFSRAVINHYPRQSCLVDNF